MGGVVLVAEVGGAERLRTCAYNTRTKAERMEATQTRCSGFMSGNRIESAQGERLASKQSRGGEIQTFNDPMLVNRFFGVHRAGRQKSATW